MMYFHFTIEKIHIINTNRNFSEYYKTSNTVRKNSEQYFFC
uniref:Uncharacterized protein n=1 Tax=Anguilla anguilla TaxID=7936 RepID=A0A0E9WKN5_ANGAN